jgi:ATP-dependent protease HslVU (ClpYQ) peptidase subunit
MTTVVWDGISLAADRRITHGTDVVGYVVKIRRCLDGRLIGGSGELDAMTVLLDWLENTDDRPDCLSVKSVAEAIEILPNQEVWLHLQYGKSKLVKGPHAIGSGAGYARAAMACGRSSVEAVRIAAMFDTGTGGKVDCLRLKED